MDTLELQYVQYDDFIYALLLVAKEQSIKPENRYNDISILLFHIC